MRIFQVAAHWDPEARVWWAESDDVTSDLRELVPELLRINLGLNEKSIQFRLVADRVEDVHQA
jgi:hypothetical protein